MGVGCGGCGGGWGVGKWGGSGGGRAERRNDSLFSFNYSFLSRASGVRCAGWDSDYETS